MAPSSTKRHPFTLCSSRYLNGESTDVVAIGRSASLPSGERLNWLLAGLAALHLTVPLVSVTGIISPIQAITIGFLDLGFDAVLSRTRVRCEATHRDGSDVGAILDDGEGVGEVSNAAMVESSA